MTGASGVLLGIVVVLLAAVAGVAFWQVRSLQRRLHAVETRAASLANEIDAAPFDLSRTLGDGRRRLITIEILNPLEVAANESKMARRIGPIAPNLIRGEVTRQAVRELETQLEAQGIDAEVRVHDGR